jgi:ABC-type transport system involved in cytochrome c biogenesis permease subunit
MGPWIVLAAFVAGINLFAFIAVRGRWGRLVPVLALASLVGTIGGNAVGQRTGLELVRIGDFHVLAASVLAQLAMLAVALLSAIGPVRLDE